MRGEGEALLPYHSSSQALRPRGEATHIHTHTHTPTGGSVSETTQALEEVCAFVRECVRVGVSVEITCVNRPDVDVEAVRVLAKKLGASFRVRPYFE